MELAKQSNNRQTALKYQVDEKQIRNWRLSEDKIRETINNSLGSPQRVHGGGRKVHDTELDAELVA